MTIWHAIRGSVLTLALCMAAGSSFAASAPAVEATNGMIVTSQRLASEAGSEILRAGGNAVDAAVAVGYAQAVVNPCCGNIGGGGFLVLRMADGRERFINFREKAPAAATADMYLDAAGAVVRGASLDGYKAAGVPGTVLGLETALSKYGTMTRAQVIAPAIRLAREGFVLTRGDTDIMEARKEQLGKHENVARIFLRPDRTSWQPGDRFIQSDLAATLETISREGAAGFYKGDIPRQVEEASKKGGGLLTAADFAAYDVTESEPLRCSYRGNTILSAPPPSSGGVTMCQILRTLEGYDMASMGFRSAQSIHLMVEAMRHAYLDRNSLLGDPAFVKNPVERLLSDGYVTAIRARINPDRPTPSSDVRPGVAPHEHPETTHYSVMDAAGNAVSVTYTINGQFGAGVIAGNTGFLLNNEMDDFTLKTDVPNMYGLVQGSRNAIAAGKRPLSSMSPTIVLRDGRPTMVVGSPGGSRIITITLQAIMNVIDYGMDPQSAVDAPRIHHQWLPDEIFVEPFAVSPDTAKILRGMGYKLTEQTAWGAAEMIATGDAAKASKGPASSGNDTTFVRGPRQGFLYGANDNRRPAGLAVGN